MERGNLLSGLPRDLPGELFTVLAASASVRIERIVSSGHASPPGTWYDQDTHEWVGLLAGAARLEVEGEPALLELGPGDWVNIPAHRRHRVAWTSAEMPTVWIAVHYD